MSRLEEYTMEPLTVAVVGLGKIGLPLAVQFASRGIRVFGIDISEEVVLKTNSGLAHFKEPGMARSLEEVVKSGLLQSTTDFRKAIQHSSHIVVLVPLYVDSNGEPDFTNIDQATLEIGRWIEKGSTVIFETTLPVGSTKSRFSPMIEKASGMKAGEDFFVAFSPERVASGTVFADFSKYPKLVGGINAESSQRAANLYRLGFEFDTRTDLEQPNGIWFMGSAEAAEFAKLAETTYRDVNIALANTFASHAEELGVSYAAVRDACNSQPFSMLHAAGISVGGHCIPVYPHMYLQSDKSAQLVKLARAINKDAPERAVQQVSERLGDLQGRHILVSGLSYRTGVKEAAFSGAIDLYQILLRHGADVHLVDELFDAEEVVEMGFGFNPDQIFDAIIINSGSREFQVSLLSRLDPEAVVMDGRSILRKSDWKHLIQIGEGAKN